MWSLFCPNEAPGLAETHSAAFEKLYLGEFSAHRPPRRLWLLPPLTHSLLSLLSPASFQSTRPFPARLAR